MNGKYFYQNADILMSNTALYLKYGFTELFIYQSIYLSLFHIEKLKNSRLKNYVAFCPSK